MQFYSISKPKAHFPYWSVIILLKLLLSSATTVAQPQTEAADLEINGLLIDETVTKLGRDFYELLYARWNAPKTSIKYTVYIKEQVQPGQGTRVSVLLNDSEIMSQVLQPREEILLALASRATQLIRYQILNYQQMAQQLENKDQYGSGIF